MQVNSCGVSVANLKICKLFICVMLVWMI